ncbi:MAG: RidA family protein [Pseudomonadota bacterium]
MAIKPTRFPWFDYGRYSFSLGVQAGTGIYLSGHTASEYDGAAGRMVVKGGMAAQTRIAYAKIGAILESAGRSLGDVTRIVEYVRTDAIERYAEAASVRTELFGAHRPVVNTVPVKSLLRPDALIEIEATAGAPEARASAGVVFCRRSSRSTRRARSSAAAMWWRRPRPCSRRPPSCSRPWASASIAWSRRSITSRPRRWPTTARPAASAKPSSARSIPAPPAS